MYLSAVCLHPVKVNISFFFKAECAAALVFSELQISRLYKSSRIKKNLTTFLLY